MLKGPCTSGALPRLPAWSCVKDGVFAQATGRTGLNSLFSSPGGAFLLLSRGLARADWRRSSGVVVDDTATSREGWNSGALNHRLGYCNTVLPSVGDTDLASWVKCTASLGDWSALDRETGVSRALSFKRARPKTAAELIGL